MSHLNNEENVNQLAFFAAYLFLSLFEPFLFCYFGHNIISCVRINQKFLNKSIINDILSVAYETAWIPASKKFKSDLVIFMIRLQDPLVVIIVKLFPMTLQAFVGVRVALSPITTTTTTDPFVSDNKSFLELLYVPTVVLSLKN